MTLRAIFANNVKFYRKNTRLSQQQLAELCGIATNYLSEIETGRKFPSVEMIERISEELEISAHLLFIDSSKVSPAPRTDEAALAEKKRNGEFSATLLKSVGEVLKNYGFLE